MITGWQNTAAWMIRSAAANGCAPLLAGAGARHFVRLRKFKTPASLTKARDLNKLRQKQMAKKHAYQIMIASDPESATTMTVHARARTRCADPRIDARLIHYFKD